MSDPITRLNNALEGRYTIERELGEGGMATVYLADDLRHERKVALKVLKPELAAMLGAERFLAEIKVTANLTHPNILPLHDSGEADGFLFYVMPYLEGETLQHRIDREKQLPVDEAVRIATAVANALDHAHRQKVIHRDIKPANLLLQDGEPLVADFGIALAVGAAGGSRLTETGLSLGTLFYMSPEQATGDQAVGPPSDTFALACVLYEMLVGEPPYAGNTAQAVLGKIIQGLPVSATATRKSVPANVDAAIRKALEMLPADRFAGVQDFAKALADPGYRYGEVDAAAVGTLAGRWKNISMGLAVTTLALGALVGWLFLRPGPTDAVAQYSIVLPPAQDFRWTGRESILAVDPTGEWFVYRGGSGEGSDQLFLRRHDQLEATPLFDAVAASPNNPSVSPDGTKVAFTSSVTAQTRLMVATIGGGPPITIVDSLEVRGSISARSSVSWADDGYIYFDSGPEGPGIFRIPEGGGTREQVTAPSSEAGEQSHIAPHALPSGSGVLFEVLHPDGTHSVAAHNLKTGQHTTLASGALAPRYSPTGHLVYVSEEGALVAAPFDQATLTITGDHLEVFDGVLISGNGRTDVALGADGTLMYVGGGSDEGLQEVVWVTRDGVVSKIDPEWLPGDYRDPALSPSGLQLALTVTQNGEPEIWVKQLPLGRFSPFTSEGGQRATWAPDGRTVAFWSDREGSFGVYQRRSDGSAPAELVPGLEAGSRVGQVIYSKDGEWMIVESGQALYSVRLDSSGAPQGELRDFGTSEDRRFQPALSPDGRWLAYVSGGAFTVTVCPFPTCEITYSVATAGPTLPTWTSDGGELFYRKGGFLRVVDVLADTTFDWGEERTLFDVSGFSGNWPHPFDLARDDERFVVIRGAEEGGGSIQLIVVRNFSEVLERLFAPRSER
jgi:Tol biopolymer transport system component